MDETRGSLIGVLAESWWIRRHAELTMTLALAHLLGDRTCAARFARLVGQRVGTTMPVLTRWVTEQVQPDRGRPDVEAVLDGAAGDVSLVKIEAKLGAELSPEQLGSFARDQLVGRDGQPLADDGHTRFVVLVVPKTRRPDACGLFKKMGAAKIGADGPGFRLTTEAGGPVQLAAVVTWEELITTFQGGGDEAGDAAAFQDLYDGLHAVAIAPFSVDDLTEPGWKDARADIASVLKTATERMFTGQVNPWRAELPDFHGRRYVSRMPGTGERTHFAVGIRPPRPQAPTPAWLRYHYETPGFDAVAERLRQPGSPYCAMLTADDRGSLWIPLYLPDDASFEAAVGAVAEQIAMIDDTARGEPQPTHRQPRPLTAADLAARFPKRRPIFRVWGGEVSFADGDGEYALIVDESTLAEIIDDPDGELAALTAPCGLVFASASARWAHACADDWIAKARRGHRPTGRPRHRSGHAHRPPPRD